MAKFTAEEIRNAHAMARKFHVKGECYAVTFGQCFRIIRQLVARVKTRTIGEPLTLTPCEIAAFHDDVCTGYKLTGTTHSDGTTYPEAFACFKSARMAQYVASLLEQSEGHSLTLTISSRWGDTEYKITR